MVERVSEEETEVIEKVWNEQIVIYVYLKPS
jgi:hypothetical protein